MARHYCCHSFLSTAPGKANEVAQRLEPWPGSRRSGKAESERHLHTRQVAPRDRRKVGAAQQVLQLRAQREANDTFQRLLV